MADLTNQKALVTGGTRGIGRAIAEALLDSGGEVVVTGRTPGREGWWTEAARCSYEAVDFSDREAVSAFCERMAAAGFNLLVNNAGAFHADTVDSFDGDSWDDLLHVNLKVPMQLIGALTSSMKNGGGGRVVNVGSIAGFVSRSGLAGYSASKAGLAGLTRAAALDLAKDGTLVNCLCPAYTETDMLASLDETARAALLEKVPLGRFCQPAEVAKAALFLLSPDNTFITGQTLIIDGGVVLQ